MVWAHDSHAARASTSFSGPFTVYLVRTDTFVSITHNQPRMKLSPSYLVQFRSAKSSDANAKCAVSEVPAP